MIMANAESSRAGKIQRNMRVFHSFLIVFSASSIYFINGILFKIQGLLYPELIESFQKDEVAVSWLFGTRTGVGQLGALLCCWLADFFEYRSMCIFGTLLVFLGTASSVFITDFTLFCFANGLVTGIGMGFQYVPAAMVTQMSFDKRAALAIAIAQSGSSVASFVYAPILQILINFYGWRGAVLITAAVCFNGCVFAMVLVPPLNSPNRQNADSQNGSISNIETKCMEENIKDTKGAFLTASSKAKAFFADLHSHKLWPTFCSVLIFMMLFILTFITFYNFLPLVASTFGISKETVSYLFSVYGVFEIVGAIAFGTLGSTMKPDSVLVWCAAMFGCGISLICLTWAKSIYLLYPLSALYGLMVGGWLTYFFVSLTSLFGLERMPKVYGILQIGQIPTYFSSTTIFASFGEATGKPQLIFLLAGCLMMFGGVILLLHHLIRKYKTRRQLKLNLSK